MKRKTKPKAEERPSAAPPRLAYSVDALATACDLSRSLIYQDIASGTLPARKKGSRTLILASDVEVYLTKLPVLAPSKAAVEG